jgi:hypothetical protein
MYAEKGYIITRSHKSKAAISLRPKLKAFRVHSPHKHNQKLNTGNLEAHYPTKYRYIVQGISLLAIPMNNYTYFSTKAKFLHQTKVKFLHQTRSIGYSTGKVSDSFSWGRSSTFSTYLQSIVRRIFVSSYLSTRTKEYHKIPYKSF